MNKKNYSDEFKLQVIKDYLNSSLGCRAIAKKYNLPSKNYVDKWKKQLEKENYRLKAELAFYKEYRRLLDEDSKKKS